MQTRGSGFQIISANDADRRALAEIADLLDDQSRLLAGDREIEIPESVRQVLEVAMEALVKGDAVSVAPIHAELTTQQAADLLKVSRPHLIKLLDQDEIPHHFAGAHRRIKLSDLLQYCEERAMKRREALGELTRMSQELGLYDLPGDADQPS